MGTLSKVRGWKFIPSWDTPSYVSVSLHPKRKARNIVFSFVVDLQYVEIRSVLNLQSEIVPELDFRSDTISSVAVIGEREVFSG